MWPNRCERPRPHRKLIRVRRERVCLALREAPGNEGHATPRACSNRNGCPAGSEHRRRGPQAIRPATLPKRNRDRPATASVAARASPRSRAAAPQSRPELTGPAPQVRGIFGTAQLVRALQQLVGSKIAELQADLLQTHDLQTLPLFDGADEGTRIMQAVMSAGVEPRISSSEPGNPKLVTFHVSPIDIGDLQLTARGRLETGGNVDDLVVEEI